VTGSPTPSDAPAPPPDDASFEELRGRLERIVSELEGGELPLERALSLFEEGVRLTRRAQERLDAAERRIDELLAVDGSGRVVTRPFEAVAKPDAGSPPRGNERAERGGGRGGAP
jgi:exodeoxyribonuclease VII small subunit